MLISLEQNKAASNYFSFHRHLKVTKPGIGDLLEGLITEYFEQRFVINSNDQVTAAQYKESGLIKGISDCKGLPPLPLGHSVIQQHE